MAGPGPAKTSPAAFSSNIFSGTSGWAYSSWKPDFYAAHTPAKQFLRSYATKLNSVEVNYTFRKLPSASSLQSWLGDVPAGFRFSFKAPQRITHFARLRECAAAVEEFVNALAPMRTAGKLGPLLFQLPPNFKADPALLAAFLAAPTFAQPDRPRVAFEFRHQSWFNEEVYAILRANQAAMCIAESDDLKTPEVQCAPDFAYFRLRSSGGYDARQIAAFAKRLLATAETREVFAYLKHEDQPTGALNAIALLKACAVKAGKR